MAEQAPAYIYFAFVFAYGNAGAAPTARFPTDGTDYRRAGVIRHDPARWAFV
jgi:hypothetical protein